MLSPAIKIHKFDLSTGNINASLINIDYKKTYKLEFSNINFDSINSKITVNNIDISNITNIKNIRWIIIIINNNIIIINSCFI